jgi:hypothetical protein
MTTRVKILNEGPLDIEVAELFPFDETAKTLMPLAKGEETTVTLHSAKCLLVREIIPNGE